MAKTDMESTSATPRLPYVVQPTSVPKILAKIQEAKAPDRFTTDFLQTKLGFKGGNYKQFIPLAKKLGLLESDGRPSALYQKYRNPTTSKAAIAQAMRNGYREIFERNEYAHSLKKDDLKGLVLEITGLEPTSDVVQRVCQTFDLLKGLADFEDKAADLATDIADKGGSEGGLAEEGGGDAEHVKLKMGLAYTINLVLPKTDDPAVFNAIFRSLRDNLLRH